jgi:hypothetical protein
VLKSETLCEMGVLRMALLIRSYNTRYLLAVLNLTILRCNSGRLVPLGSDHVPSRVSKLVMNASGGATGLDTRAAMRLTTGAASSRVSSAS